MDVQHIRLLNFKLMKLLPMLGTHFQKLVGDKLINFHLYSIWRHDVAASTQKSVTVLFVRMPNVLHFQLQTHFRSGFSLSHAVSKRLAKLNGNRIGILLKLDPFSDPF